MTHNLPCTVVHGGVRVDMITIAGLHDGQWNQT